MSQKTLVRRLIDFLKKPEAVDRSQREPVYNAYDDYEPHANHAAAAPTPGETPVPEHEHERSEPLMASRGERSPGQASRLDALIMRAIQQFGGQFSFVIRYDERGRMRYVTGRDMQGRYVDHTAINPDRHALLSTLDSGQSQLFTQTAGRAAIAVLCGPLWIDDEVVGLLYIDSPARSRLHRGVFDVFCEQAARMLLEEPA
jgi:hypothetical protein